MFRSEFLERVFLCYSSVQRNIFGLEALTLRNACECCALAMGVRAVFHSHVGGVKGERETAQSLHKAEGFHFFSTLDVVLSGGGGDVWG